MKPLDSWFSATHCPVGTGQAIPHLGTVSCDFQEGRTDSLFSTAGNDCNSISSIRKYNTWFLVRSSERIAGLE